MKKTFALTIIALLLSTPAFADAGVRRTPCGYQQITVTTLQKLVIPAVCGPGPYLAVIKVETQAVRYRDDGVAPTATVGQPIATTDAPVQYEGTASALQFIAQVAGGVVDVLLYK